MRKFHPINWIQYLTLILAAATAVAFVIVFIRIEHIQSHQNDALRSVICHAIHVNQTQPDIPEKQRRESLRFFRQSLAVGHLKPCEENS